MNLINLLEAHQIIVFYEFLAKTLVETPGWKPQKYLLMTYRWTRAFLSVPNNSNGKGQKLIMIPIFLVTEASLQLVSFNE